jgi:hypothetical protein
LRTGTRLPKIKPLILIALIGLFIYGLIELFNIRFRSGDVYPPYSSMRSDPLGSKAYYDALASMQALSVKRNFRPVPRLDSDSTLFLIGVNYWSVMFMDEEEIKVLESFVSGGGRLVLTFVPAADVPYFFKHRDKEECGTKDDNHQGTDCKKADEKQPDDKKPEENKKITPYKKPFTSLYDRWAFRVGFDESVKTAIRGKGIDTVLATNEYALSPSIRWHSIAFIENPAEGWQAIYKTADRPVLIEKKYGKGSIVIATDSYFASNEAVLKERHPDLLAWLAGPHKFIIFDETHNGIAEHPGVASLLFKYRLHGLLAAFLLMAALFVWQNSSSLVPKRTGQEDDSDSTGKDYLSGLTSLLRRNIPKRELLQVCVSEWKKSGSVLVPKEKLDRVEKSAASFKDKSVGTELQVNAYRYITKILSKRAPNENRDRPS